jgi:hypothetical protein
MQDVYVYYRVDEHQLETATARVDALLRALAPHCVRRPRRAARCDDAATWMEIYEGIDDFAAFSATLAERVQALACTAFIRGERHVECFRAAAP